MSNKTLLYFLSKFFYFTYFRNVNLKILVFSLFFQKLEFSLAHHFYAMMFLWLSICQKGFPYEQEKS